MKGKEEIFEWRQGNEGRKTFPIEEQRITFDFSLGAMKARK